jgi:hypothetical protein
VLLETFRGLGDLHLMPPTRSRFVGPHCGQTWWSWVKLRSRAQPHGVFGSRGSVRSLRHDGQVTGELHPNDWFRDWLMENQISDEAAAYEAAKDPRRLADLVNRAEAQEAEPVGPLVGASLVAGRSLDLTGYIACGHPDCLTRQVDCLFARVWHYFDSIAIVGPDAHQFLEQRRRKAAPDVIAKGIASRARPIFHIRDIGADELVTWVAKPPACDIHWKEFEDLHAYHLPEELERVLALTLLREGQVRLDKNPNKPTRLVLRHPQLFSGADGVVLSDLMERREGNDSVELTLARRIVRLHWIGAASDIYTARLMSLPLGLGVGLVGQPVRPEIMEVIVQRS